MSTPMIRSARVYARALRDADIEMGPVSVDARLALLRDEIRDLKDLGDDYQALIAERDRLAERLDLLEVKAGEALADMPFPVTPPSRRQTGQIMHQAQADVAQLACDVRETDPALIWGRLSSWSPQRLLCVLIAAAACVDPDRPLAEQAAWIAEQGLDQQVAA